MSAIGRLVSDTPWLPLLTIIGFGAAVVALYPDDPSGGQVWALVLSAFSVSLVAPTYAIVSGAGLRTMLQDWPILTVLSMCLFLFCSTIFAGTASDAGLLPFEDVWRIVFEIAALAPLAYIAWWLLTSLDDITDAIDGVVGVLR